MGGDVLFYLNTYADQPKPSTRPAKLFQNACCEQAATSEARDAELRREHAARQLSDVQKLAAQEASTATSLRNQLAKAKAAGPAAVSMPQVGCCYILSLIRNICKALAGILTCTKLLIAQRAYALPWRRPSSCPPETAKQRICCP